VEILLVGYKSRFSVKQVRDQSIKENGFTDQEIIAIVWCAASLVLHPLIMDDEELDRLMAGKTTLNTQGENPTVMNT
jgi:hypothetical protein